MQDTEFNYINDQDYGQIKELQGMLDSFGAGGSELAPASLDLKQLCEKYHQIRGTLELVLKAVEKIPGVGKKIAKAVRFLMTVADFACPTETDAAALTSISTEESGAGTFSLSLEQIEAFDRLDASLGGAATGFADGGLTATALDKAQICEQYRKVRKFLGPVLPIIRLIPGVGGTIAGAIEILMAIGDSICGANG